jgi:hypothetical protein
VVRLLEAKEDTEHIQAAALRPRMLLAKDLRRRLERDEELADEHFGFWYPDGLTAPQAEAVRGWCDKNGIAEIQVMRTVHFGFWIFFGFGMTLWLNQDLLTLASKLLSSASG